ncbi:MAG: hypothetical protein JO234_07585 [Hyphomicrobiales bacterium]|nr:hypothetical protein [Hyphomicrobiales bacterium]
MTVSAIPSIVAYIPVAPVDKVAPVRRAVPKNETKKSSKAAKGELARSPESTSSSTVLSILSGLQTGG